MLRCRNGAAAQTQSPRGLVRTYGREGCKEGSSHGLARSSLQLPGKAARLSSRLGTTINHWRAARAIPNIICRRLSALIGHHALAVWWAMRW
jgi:hypothetical protein